MNKISIIAGGAGKEIVGLWGYQFTVLGVKTRKPSLNDIAEAN
jgi:hypothetical protein